MAPARGATTSQPAQPASAKANAQFRPAALPQEPASGPKPSLGRPKAGNLAPTLAPVRRSSKWRRSDTDGIGHLRAENVLATTPRRARTFTHGEARCCTGPRRRTHHEQA